MPAVYCQRLAEIAGDCRRVPGDYRYLLENVGSDRRVMADLGEFWRLPVLAGVIDNS